MKIAKWLKDNTELLQSAGIESARLDCLILLEDALGLNRAQILARPEFTLSTALLKQLNSRIAARKTHLPLAYIRGKTEFYGREFLVNDTVLVPRPESEQIITTLKRFAKKYIINTAVDIGTGSGALAITAKLTLPNLEVMGVDISEECLTIAQQNAEALGAAVTLARSDLLESVQLNSLGQTALLVNLPYVPTHHPINQAAAHEPTLALFGGNDGLDLYRTLFDSFKKQRPLAVLCESLETQHEALQSIAHEHDYVLAETNELVQLFTDSAQLQA